MIEEVHYLVESKDGEFAHSMGGVKHLSFDKDKSFNFSIKLQSGGNVTQWH